MPTLALLLALAVLALAGCGAADDVQREARDRVESARERFEQLRDQAEDLGRQAEEIGADVARLRERLAERVREVLAQIRQSVPAASLPAPARRRDTAEAQFLASVLRSVDDYWRRTLVAADLPAPSVRAAFPGIGEAIRSGCGAAAGEASAFYCPADDTLYIGQGIARQVAQATGDFGAAFIVAHEYAHNIQQELGWYETSRRLDTVQPFELQADCLAGTWANAVYRSGELDPGDIEEAQRTAEAVGDFDELNPQHHGTPTERREAWTLGFDSGDPAACRRFV